MDGYRKIDKVFIAGRLNIPYIGRKKIIAAYIFCHEFKLIDCRANIGAGLVSQCIQGVKCRVCCDIDHLIVGKVCDEHRRNDCEYQVGDEKFHAQGNLVFIYVLDLFD